MNNNDFKRFKRFYDENKTPQFITALIKCNSKDKNSSAEILSTFPAYRNERFWDGKFWKGKLIDVLSSVEGMFPILMNFYFSQEKKYNDDFLNYLFRNKSDLLIEALKKTDALTSKKHLSRFIENSNILEFLIEEMPEEILWGLRTSGLFLDDLLWPKMCCINKGNNSSIKKHYEVFVSLRSLNNSFITAIDSNENLFANPQLLLSYLAVWHSEIKFQQTKNDKLIENHSNGTYLVAAYNYLLERISLTKGVHSEQDISDVYALQSHPVQEKCSGKKLSKYWLLLNDVLKYVSFRADMLEWYCYDSNCEPIFDESGNLLLKAKSELEEVRWLKNGKKYEFWNSYHLLKGNTAYYSEVLNNLESYRKIYKNEEGFDFHAEYHSAMFRNKHFFSDLNFQDIGDENIPKIADLAHTLEALKGNVIKNHVEPKLNYFEQTNIFSEALKYSFIPNGNNAPITEIRLEYYEDLIQKCMNISKLSFDKAKSVIDFHISEVFPTRGEGDQKLSENFHVEDRPIIKMGKICFIMPWLFEYITPSHSIYNNLYRTNKEKNIKLGCLIEEQIRKEFVNCDFVVKSFNQVGNTGDYDCLAYKNGVLFVVQVKSTYLRATLQDNFFHTNREIIKATSQVHRNLKDIHDNFEEIKTRIGFSENKIEDLNIIPLIITTSFEKDGELIPCMNHSNRSIHKLSLFELQIILRGEEQNLFSYNELYNCEEPPLFESGNKRTDPNEIINILEGGTVWNKLNVENMIISNPVLLKQV